MLTSDFADFNIFLNFAYHLRLLRKSKLSRCIKLGPATFEHYYIKQHKKLKTHSLLNKSMLFTLLFTATCASFTFLSDSYFSSWKHYSLKLHKLFNIKWDNLCYSFISWFYILVPSKSTLARYYFLHITLCLQQLQFPLC